MALCLLVLPLLTFTACTQAVVPLDLEVLAVRPADSAAFVPQNVTPAFWFNTPPDDDTSFVVRLDGEDGSRELACVVNDGAPSVLCPLDEELEKDSVYQLTLDLDDDGLSDITSVFDTGLPDGQAYDIGRNLQVIQAGGNDLAAQLMTDLLAGDTTTLLQLEDFDPQVDALPWRGTFLMGRGLLRPEVLEDGAVVVDGEYGFHLVTRGVIRDDGRFQAVAERVTLPIDVEGDVVHLLLEHVLVAGTLRTDLGFEQLDSFSITGHVPVESMEEALTALPDWARSLVNLLQAIEADEDLDGDGHDESCYLEIWGDGVHAEILPPRD